MASRDGVLVVVDRKLMTCVRVPQIAETLQQAIENWSVVAPKLRPFTASSMPARPRGRNVLGRKRESPLPRAYQFLDGSVYLSHMRKARKARGAEMPPNFETEPLMYQAVSDGFIGPVDDMPLPTDELGIDMEAEVAIVVDDVPMGTSRSGWQTHQTDHAAQRLYAEVADQDRTSERLRIHAGEANQCFSPVAVTLDELPQWDGEKLNLPLISSVNGKRIGAPHAGKDMYFTYPQLIAHAARTRKLGAGTIIGAGTVAKSDEAMGSSCIAEMRANEEIEHGKASTSFLKFGDSVRIEMFDKAGQTIFGAIDQKVVKS